MTNMSPILERYALVGVTVLADILTMSVTERALFADGHCNRQSLYFSRCSNEQHKLAGGEGGGHAK